MSCQGLRSISQQIYFYFIAHFLIGLLIFIAVGSSEQIDRMQGNPNIIAWFRSTLGFITT